MAFCVVGHSGEKEADKAFGKIMDEANFVSEHLIRYLSGLMDAIAKKYLEEQYGAPEPTLVETQTSFGSSTLEFFMNIDPTER
jgi:hypothetical protein